MLKMLQLYKFKILNRSKTWPHEESDNNFEISTPQFIPKMLSNTNPYEIHLKL